MITLKCLEKDPEHRYASTKALSDDLNRWLRGEPISARPVGPVVRLRMWAKRKPALAGLSAALILAPIAGARRRRLASAQAVAEQNSGQLARDEASRQRVDGPAAATKAKTARGMRPSPVRNEP